jgi:hypothetical protein
MVLFGTSACLVSVAMLGLIFSGIACAPDESDHEPRTVSNTGPAQDTASERPTDRNAGQLSTRVDGPSEDAVSAAEPAGSTDEPARKADNDSLGIPQGYWNLVVDGADWSGNGRDGTPVGTLPSASSVTDTQPALPGVGGKGINVPFHAALNSESFTVSIWAKVEGGQDRSRALVASCEDLPDDSRGYLVSASSDNRWRFATGTGSTGRPWDVLEGPAVTPNRWTHLAVTFQATSELPDGAYAGEMHLYVEGKRVATKSGRYKPNRAQALRIGVGTDGDATDVWDGPIADVAIWDRAFSDGDIATVHAWGCAAEKSEQQASEQLETPPQETPPPEYGFTGQPLAMSLPPVDDAGHPVVLGRVRLAPDTVLEMELLGGDRAYRVQRMAENEVDSDPPDERAAFEDLGTESAAPRPKIEGVRTFELERVDRGDENHTWRVRVYPEKVEIAQFRVEKGKLQFQWTLGAAVHRKAGYLANCVLVLRADYERTQPVVLREPVQATRVHVAPAKGSTLAAYAIDHSPPIDVLDFEIRGVSDNLPKYMIDPGNIINVHERAVWLKFGDGAPFVLRIHLLPGQEAGKFHMATRAYINLPVYPAYMFWNADTLSAKRREVDARLKELASLHQRVSRVKTTTAAQRQARNRQLADIRRKRAAGAQALERIRWLAGLQQSVGDQGRVDFRVLHRVDGYDVDLLRTYDPSNPAAAAEDAE